MSRSSSLAVALVFGLAVPLAGQQRGTGSIRGVVYDSLVTSAPLAGALVEIAELGRETRTNIQGVFRFDSLPAGTFTVSFTDSTLRAIGFTPPDRTVQLGDGIDLALPLATPSGRTIYRLLCPGNRDDATGVLLGTLREASSGRPLAGSEVRADWTVTSLTRESGFVRRPSVVRAAVDSLGRYQLCGVPTDVPVLLRSVVAGTSGAPLELRMSDRAFAVRHLSQDVSPAGAGTAVATGKVTADGAPVPGAQVLVLGDEQIARTDEQGRYRLADLPAGSHTIEARAIGFERRRLGIELRSGDSTAADLALARLAVTLPELNVTEVAGQGGFDERRRRAVGGYFMSSEDIARFGTVRVEDLFRHVPGMRVEPVGVNDYRILSYRGQGISAVCEPTVFIDDVYIPLDPESGLALPVSPEEIHGIEVYQGPGSAPLQYRNRGEACGVILIWTRRFRR